MGLDGVELVMAIEEEFALQIEDGEGEKMETVTDLTDYIYYKIKKQTDSTWTPEKAQTELVAAVKKLSPVAEKEEIDLNSELETLFEVNNRIKLWESLRKEVEASTYRWPKLIRPLWLKMLIGILSVAIPFIFMGFEYHAFVLGLFITPFFLILFTIITRKLKREFPKKIKTVESLFDAYFSTYSKGKFKYVDVMERVKEITSEQLGVPIEEVTEDAHFIHDLGMD